MKDFDLIVGIHSIVHALLNNNRSNFTLYCTEDAKSELLKKTKITKEILDNTSIKILSSHGVQEEGKKLFKRLDVEFNRIPSGMFLTCSELETYDVSFLYEQARSNDQIKILVLDQISDVHNGAAILRTASFYGVDAVVVPSRKSFKMTPSFYRIASGAAEYVNIVHANSFPKMISKLNDLGILSVALSENVTNEFNLENPNLGVCLILGKEDTGISNAVMRVAKAQLMLKNFGDIKSLNVSAAAAVSMEKCFG
ncbi:MAG: hypothetical protein N4A33_08390 [Bacteriovoracaceae bacterium]|jgi:23S rRNA (guanosine2251-2'-O)-methyltransferase|nr:hypothetical protein [Bacteriovoracaceae bacterium]